jgi:hypothetical protein
LFRRLLIATVLNSLNPLNHVYMVGGGVKEIVQEASHVAMRSLLNNEKHPEIVQEASHCHSS